MSSEITSTQHSLEEYPIFGPVPLPVTYPLAQLTPIPPLLPTPVLVIQRPFESIPDYTRAFWSVYYQSPHRIFFNEIGLLYYNGLNPEIRKRISICKHRTVREIKNLAIKLGQIRKRLNYLTLLGASNSLLHVEDNAHLYAECTHCLPAAQLVIRQQIIDKNCPREQFFLQ